MSSKTLPFWLKGIKVSFIILIIQIAFQFIDELFHGISRSSPGFFEEFFINQIMFICRPFYLISSQYGYSIFSLFINGAGNYWDYSPKLMGVILVFVFYILIGALIGLIYGKIKSSKQVKLSVNKSKPKISKK